MGSLGSSLWNPLPLPSNSYYRGIRQMVQVSDQDMNTHLAEISRVRGVGHTLTDPLGFPPRKPLLSGTAACTAGRGVLRPQERSQGGGQMGWHLRVTACVLGGGDCCRRAPACVGRRLCPWLSRAPEGCKAVTLSGRLCHRLWPHCETASCPQGHSPSLALGHTVVGPPHTFQAHTDSLNTLVALHQLYQYTQKYYDQVGVFLGWRHRAAHSLAWGLT